MEIRPGELSDIANEETPRAKHEYIAPDPLKRFVDGQILTGRYSSVSEYVRELIRADERRKAEEVLEAKLLEGLNSVETELTPEDWSAIRREALSKIEERKQVR